MIGDDDLFLAIYSGLGVVSNCSAKWPDGRRSLCVCAREGGGQRVRTADVKTGFSRSVNIK